MKKSVSTPVKSQSYTTDILRIFWKTALQHPKEAWLSLIYPVSIILTGVGVPYYIGRILASVNTNVGSTNEYIILLAACSIVGVLGNRWGFMNILLLQAKAMRDLQDQTLTTLLSRSVGFHNDRVSGKLVSDAIDFPNAFSMITGALFVNALPFFLIIVIGLSIITVHSWPMGLALLLVVIIIGGWTYLESIWRSHMRAQRQVAVKNVTAHISDTIVNAQTVKAFARETHEVRRNRSLGDILADLRIADWERGSKSANNRMLALLAFQVGFIILTVSLVKHNPALLGIGIFAFTYTLTLTQRLFEINVISRQVEEALLQAAPMAKILQEPQEVIDKPDASELTITKGEITLQSVDFHYEGNLPKDGVFKKLTLKIAAGEKIGLVGPSGGGKSTLTRLLLRFEDITGGSILFDGQNIADVTQASLRSHIAYVAQEPLLFHRSIRENIAYGRSDASDKDIIKAAEQAHAHDFIMKLPAGYDTIVGERGVKLSGGQRQRVAIARAILKDAPILLLDEATSALDSESEVLVQDALWKLMEGRTVIVIAHRLSTIQKMDRILVLKDGAIVEQGAHKDLVYKKGGMYASLWSHQSGGFVPDDES
jgi:ATP-binding cassette, subfamily B, bacterial